MWFACAPTDLKGSSLRILVNFSDGSAKQRTIDLSGINLYFEAGSVTLFSANMASAEDVALSSTEEEVVYELVTSLSSLSNGDEVIIVNSDSSPTYAMGGTASGTSGINAIAKDSGFTYSSEDGYIRLPGNSNVEVWTITNKSTSGSSTTMQFKSGSSYIYQNSSSRYLTIGSSATSWTVAFSSSGARVYYKSGSSSYSIYYSNNYFKSQINTSYCAIYKKTTVSTEHILNPEEEAILNYETYGAYFTDNPLIYSATSDQLSREYLSDGTVTFTIVDAANEAYVEFSGIPANAAYLDSFNLKLIYRVQLVNKIESTFPVTVVKEDGAKLWLTDGTNAFIVKR